MTICPPAFAVAGNKARERAIIHKLYINYYTLLRCRKNYADLTRITFVSCLPLVKKRKDFDNRLCCL